jgi:hypothetical protein
MGGRDGQEGRRVSEAAGASPPPLARRHLSEYPLGMRFPPMPPLAMVPFGSADTERE